MRNVSNRFSGVTASIASRKATWMLNRTVRNSSLASIMRTGTSETVLPRKAAACACSNSVCPG
jgi:hypothetical protein